MTNEKTNTIEIEVEVSRVYRELQRADRDKIPVVFSVGGARSTKSWSECQFLIFDKLLKIRDLKILFLRKTRTSLRISTYKQFFEILDKYKRYNEKNHNKSNMEYVFTETNGYVLFTGLDDKERIKSTGWNIIVVEEASEFDKEDFIFLKTRLSEGTTPTIHLLSNPVDSWIFDYENKPNTRWINSTYKDNKHLSKEYVEILEGLKDEDEAFYQIYTLGQRAEIKNLIYKPFEVLNKYPDKFDEIIYGLDFGFNKPTAFIEVGIKDGEYYLTQKIYETNLTNQDRIDKFAELKISKSSYIFADNEDPAAIEEIFRAGYNIQPAIKGPDSVKAGIDFCKRQKFYTLNENVELNVERKTYKWKEDKNGKILDEPVKFKDHAMDAIRYSVYTYNIMVGEKINLKELLEDNKDIGDYKSDKY